MEILLRKFSRFRVQKFIHLIRKHSREVVERIGDVELGLNFVNSEWMCGYRVLRLNSNE